MRKIKIAKIRKPHGLKGAVNVELIHSNAAILLEKSKIFIYHENQEIQLNLAKSFAHVGNLCKLQFAEYCNADQINHLRNVFLYAVDFSDNFYVEDLIGVQIISSNGKKIAKIIELHDFGAGLVFDTDKSDMFLLDQLDLESISNGTIKLK